MTPDDLRVVLEWLGLIEPDRSRREPIALPRWAPVVVGALVVGVAAVVASVLTAVLGLRA